MCLGTKKIKKGDAKEDIWIKMNSYYNGSINELLVFLKYET